MLTHPEGKLSYAVKRSLGSVCRRLAVGKTAPKCTSSIPANEILLWLINFNKITKTLILQIIGHAAFMKQKVR